MLPRQGKRPGVDDRWGSWCGLSWRSVRVRVLGFEPVVSFRSAYRTRKRASQPLPRWEGWRGQPRSSEPGIVVEGKFRPPTSRDWSAPHAAAKPVRLTAWGIHPFSLRLTASGRDPFPHRLPPHRFSPASRRDGVPCSPRGLPNPFSPAPHGAHESSVVYCEFRDGTGRSRR